MSSETKKRKEEKNKNYIPVQDNGVFEVKTFLVGIIFYIFIMILVFLMLQKGVN